MVINNAGNVGIGTSMPVAKLDINGTFRKNYEIPYDLPVILASPGWYNIGTFSGGYGSRLELKILGGEGYDINTPKNIGGATLIYTLLLNNTTTSIANIRGSFSSQGGIPVVQNLKFLQNGSNRTSYSIIAYISSYSCHTIFPTINDGDGTIGSATFTRTFTAASDPGVNSATVQAAIPQIFAVAGNVGIGTTNPQYPLHIVNPSGGNAYIRGESGNGLVLDAYANAIYFGISASLLYYMNNNEFVPIPDNTLRCGYTANRWAAVYAVNGTIQTSDEKDKDFVPLTYGLTDLMNIETIKYKWKTQQDLPDTDPAKNYEYYGFKAGNLKTIFPELVYDESETLQLNYAELMPVLVNAIKEQQTMIQDLQTRIAVLEAR